MRVKNAFSSLAVSFTVNLFACCCLGCEMMSVCHVLVIIFTLLALVMVFFLFFTSEQVIDLF